MRTSSAKAKGRRACQEVVELLLESFPQLSELDIRVTPSGVQGVDVQLSQAAVDLLPFNIECKNVEALNIWSALQQAASHRGSGRIPLLFFKRNRSELYVALNAKTFIKAICPKKE